MNKYLIILAGFLLTSCSGMLIQSSPNSAFVKFTESPWIEIKQVLQVEASNARVYLQNGKQIHPDKLDLYQTNCEIEVKQVLQLSQKILPGKFKISSIAIEDSPIVLLQYSRVQYAAIGNNAPVDIKRAWKFKLHSNHNPEVLFMICRGIQDSPFNAQLPSIEEIKQAIGDNIEVHLSL